MLYEHAKNSINNNTHKLLELGCGCGIISLALAMDFPKRDLSLSLSDLSSGAILDCKENFDNVGLRAEIKVGSLFEPWINSEERYDLIINDISGISRDVAAMSPWFDKAPMAPGNTGVELLQQFLLEAPNYLTPSGKVIFPLLNLSQTELVMNSEDSNFEFIKIKELEWPLPEFLTSNSDFESTCERLKIVVPKRFGKFIGKTTIYEGVFK
jgi:methylase of polypeptide subunit release factors